MRIKKGDKVKIISGSKKNKGKIGEVLAVFHNRNKVQVEGMAKQKKHLKPRKKAENQEGGIINIYGLIDISNVMKMDKIELKKKRDENNLSENK